MKKIIICILSIVVLLCSACSSNGTKDINAKDNHITTETTSMIADDNQKINVENNTKENEFKIVTTIFPIYDWVNQILGEKADDFDVTLLLNNGIDLHNYQPTVKDMATISDCDMFVYVGGESDDWVDDAIKTAHNKDMIVINLLDAMGDKAKTEEIIEGMEHSHDHEESEEHDHEELDEHVWLSLKNAQFLCDYIAKEIEKLDPENAEIYQKNVIEYDQQLVNLDQQYQTLVDTAKTKTLLFGDRFPFRYLVDDYGLTYSAAFSGCSAETEASFETIVFLAKKVDEEQLKSVIVIDGSDQSIAKTIITNTTGKDQEIIILDSMQSTTISKTPSDISYLSIMEENLAALKNALN